MRNSFHELLNSRSKNEMRLAFLQPGYRRAAKMVAGVKINIQ
jgi:hypothetical protein